MNGVSWKLVGTTGAGVAMWILPASLALAQEEAEAPEGSPSGDAPAEQVADPEAVSDEAEPQESSPSEEPRDSGELEDEPSHTDEQESSDSERTETASESEPAATEESPRGASPDAEAGTAAAAEPALDLPPTEVPSRAGPFAQGNIRIGGSVGWASSFGGGESNTWFILGVGAGIFAVDGLEAHGDVTTWIGDPFIATLTPGIRYVFYQVPTVKPYLGVMYRHYFLTGQLPDTDSIGFRAGLNFMINPRSYFGGGVMVEHFLDSGVFQETPQVYPELVLSLML